MHARIGSFDIHKNQDLKKSKLLMSPAFASSSSTEQRRQKFGRQHRAQSTAARQHSPRSAGLLVCWPVLEQQRKKQEEAIARSETGRKSGANLSKRKNPIFCKNPTRHVSDIEHCEVEGNVCKSNEIQKPSRSSARPASRRPARGRRLLLVSGESR